LSIAISGNPPQSYDLSYEITQCYLPPDTGERAPPLCQPCRPVFDLPTTEGWEAEWPPRLRLWPMAS